MLQRIPPSNWWGSKFSLRSDDSISYHYSNSPIFLCEGNVYFPGYSQTEDTDTRALSDYMHIYLQF